MNTYFGCSRQCLFIWLFVLLKLYLAQSIEKFLPIDVASCSSPQQPISMELKRDVTATITLDHSNTSFINKPEKCDVDLTLKQQFSRYSTTVLTISVKSGNTCLYHLEIYADNPARNRAITTLDCVNKRTWVGHWPTTNLVLRYKKISHEDGNIGYLTSVLQFKVCSLCYKLPHHNYNKANDIQNFKGTEICVDDSYTLFETRRNSLLNPGFCGRITFNVKDNVPLCFQIYTLVSISSSSKDCQTIIMINEEEVMNIKSSVWKHWCLPWPLKGKSVSFIIKKPRGYGCYCSVQILTNSTKYDTSCPVYHTTTKAQIETSSWSSWSSSVDEDNSDESKKGLTFFEIMGACVGVIFLFVLFYGILKTRCTSKNDETSNQDTNERSNEPTTNQNQPSTRNNQPAYSPVSLNETSDLQIQQQTIDSSSLCGISPSAPPYEDIHFYESQRGLRVESSPQSTPVEQRRITSTNNDESSHEMPPPPSYTDVCQNPGYYK